jgi:hypothetical protein
MSEKNKLRSGAYSYYDGDVSERSEVETRHGEGLTPRTLSPDIHPLFILLSQNPIMLAMPRN